MKKNKIKKLKLALYGSNGKMGAAIRSLLLQNNEIECFLEISSEEHKEFINSFKNLNLVSSSVLKEIDVWIDFSRVEGTLNLLKKISPYKTKLVCGTTGFTESEFKYLEKYSKSAPVFWASNMSFGLWTLRQAIKQLSSVSHFDFAIDEVHHTKKVDNPSGTAVTLQKDLESTINKKVFSNHGTRLGGVFGIHTITGASQSEILKFEHFALNRTVFAEGALKATSWLCLQKKNGLFSMDDLMLLTKKIKK